MIKVEIYLEVCIKLWECVCAEKWEPCIFPMSTHSIDMGGRDKMDFAK